MDSFETIHVNESVKNRLVRSILLFRGSKKLFGSKENMLKYMDELNGKQPPYSVDKTGKLKSSISHSTVNGFNCYTLSRTDAPKKDGHVLYFHGGAFVRELSSAHLKAVDSLVAQSGVPVTILCYPKAPSYTYRDVFSMAVELYKNMLKELKPENIAFIGDSAGATISLTLCEVLEEMGLPKPGLVCVYSPVCDLALTNSEARKLEPLDPMLGVDGLIEADRAWCGDKELNAAELNPLSMSLTALPKLMVFTGTHEILYPDTLAFVRRVRAGGVDVRLYVGDGMYHVFPLYPLESAKLALTISAEAISELVMA